MDSGIAPKGADGEERAGQEGEDEAVRALVAMVTSRGLEVPAVFCLEAARPLHMLLQQALLLADPFLRPWLGDGLPVWAGLLEDGEALERALQALSARNRARL